METQRPKGRVDKEVPLHEVQTQCLQGVPRASRRRWDEAWVDHKFEKKKRARY